MLYLFYFIYSIWTIESLDNFIYDVKGNSQRIWALIIIPFELVSDFDQIQTMTT